MEEEFDSLNDTDFTGFAWDILYDAVDSTIFMDKDADLIFHALQKKLKFISFGTYLQRYLYRKAGFTEPFEEVPVKEYQMIIKDSFAENNVPASFEPTTAKLSALSKNWLTQQTVKRKVVFLLGFGLRMSHEDVNEFLNKALREQGINAKDPFEVICWHCFSNGYGYPKFEKLWKEFLDLIVDDADFKLLYGDGTVGARDIVRAIKNDEDLMKYVARLKTKNNQLQLSVSARKCFDELFEKSRELVAEIYNREKIADDGLKTNGQKKVFQASDITEGDLEHVISSAIPVDRYGNLTPVKASRLNSQFSGKRFNRQHVFDVLAGKSEVNRFDLITLNFFIYSQSLEKYPNAKTRFMSFVEETNKILERCYLGELYVSNPYECFVLMCILSEDPLVTYADVWEKSYDVTAE